MITEYLEYYFTRYYPPLNKLSVILLQGNMVIDMTSGCIPGNTYEFILTAGNFWVEKWSPVGDYPVLRYNDPLVVQTQWYASTSPVGAYIPPTESDVTFEER